MTPDPALWNWRSRGFESGGASKNRRKKGSSSSGLWPDCSLMVPRVAMFTTEGETRLTMGASVGMGRIGGSGTAASGLHADRRRGERGCGKLETKIHARSFRVLMAGGQSEAGRLGPASSPGSRRYYTEGPRQRTP